MITKIISDLKTYFENKINVLKIFFNTFADNFKSLGSWFNQTCFSIKKQVTVKKGNDNQDLNIHQVARQNGIRPSENNTATPFIDANPLLDQYKREEVDINELLNEGCDTDSSDAEYSLEVLIDKFDEEVTTEERKEALLALEASTTKIDNPLVETVSFDEIPEMIKIDDLQKIDENNFNIIQKILGAREEIKELKIENEKNSQLLNVISKDNHQELLEQLNEKLLIIPPSNGIFPHEFKLCPTEIINNISNLRSLFKNCLKTTNIETDKKKEILEIITNSVYETISDVVLKLEKTKQFSNFKEFSNEQYKISMNYLNSKDIEALQNLDKKNSADISSLFISKLNDKLKHLNIELSEKSFAIDLFRKLGNVIYSIHGYAEKLRLITPSDMYFDSITVFELGDKEIFKENKEHSDFIKKLGCKYLNVDEDEDVDSNYNYYSSVHQVQTYIFSESGKVMHAITSSDIKIKKEFKDISQDERKKIYLDRKSKTLKLQEELRNSESLISLLREENNRLKDEVKEKNIDNSLFLSLLEPLNCIATHKILNQSNI